MKQLLLAFQRAALLSVTVVIFLLTVLLGYNIITVNPILGVFYIGFFFFLLTFIFDLLNHPEMEGNNYYLRIKKFFYSRR